MPESAPLIVFLLAAPAELTPLRPALDLLDRLGCPYDVQVRSPWTAPQKLLDYVLAAQDRGVRVLIAPAGEVPHLPALLAAAGRLPVVAVPLPGRGFAAEDRLPLAFGTSPAAPVVSVAPEAAEHAALLALRLIAQIDTIWQPVLAQYHRQMTRDQEELNRDLREQWLAGESADDEDETEIPVPRLRRRQQPAEEEAYDAGDAEDEAALEDEEDETGADEDQDAAESDDSEEVEAAEGDEDDDDDFMPQLKGKMSARQEPPIVPTPRFVDSDEPAVIRPVSFDQPLSGPVVGRAQPAGEPAKPVADVPLSHADPRKARRLGRHRIDADSPEVELIEDAIDCLLEGGVIALPTDTVYGLACDATNPAAVALLSELKGRPPGKAISLLVDSQKQLGMIACNITVEIRRLTEAFWPGPLTILFRKRPGNFAHISGGESIAVRLPDHSTPLAIMQALARPLAFTSAALPGSPEPMTADAVDELHEGRLHLILDGGPLPAGPPSTVIDVTGSTFKILRQGGVSQAQLSAIVGDLLES